MAQRSNSNRSNSGSNQAMMSHWAGTAKDRPMATAAAAAGAVAAGVFLWSRRNQISDQINRLSDQISDWRQDMGSGSSSRELAMTDGPNESSAIESSRSTKARSGTSSRTRSTPSRATSGQSRSAGQNMNAGRGGSGSFTA